MGRLHILLLILIQLFASKAQTSHFCTKLEQRTMSVIESYQATKHVTTEYACWSHIICTKLKVIRYTAYRLATRTQQVTVQYCCPGWTGTQCDREDEVKVVLKPNAVEYDITDQKFGEKSARSSSSTTKYPTAQIVLPVCLLVMIAILLVVAIYSWRRYRLFKRNQALSGEYIIAYSASPPSEEQSVPEALCAEADSLPACSDGACAEEVPLSVKCKETTVDLPDQCVSYKSRMNDLNSGEQPAEADEEKITNIESATVTIYRQSTDCVESRQLLPSADANCESDDENDLDLSSEQC